MFVGSWSCSREYLYRAVHIAADAWLVNSIPYRKVYYERHELPALARTRDFDLDAAIDSALQQFWKKGYEGTSLTDLTEAMGINRPSLYAAFGNKEGLFRRVLERYIANTGQQLQAALSAPTRPRWAFAGRPRPGLTVPRHHRSAAGQTSR